MHAHKDIWDAAIGEVLACERESHNVEDCYAVVVKKIEGIIEHLPQNLSRVCSLFIRRGGIECTITRARRYSGGLEIPCLLLFKASPKEVKKLKKLWKKQLATIQVLACISHFLNQNFVIL